MQCAKEIFCDYPNIRKRNLKKKGVSRYKETIHNDKNFSFPGRYDKSKFV